MQMSHYIIMTRESALLICSLMSKPTEMSHNDSNILQCYTAMYNRTEFLMKKQHPHLRNKMLHVRQFGF